MKTLLLSLCLAACAAAQAQHSLTKIWESDTTLAVPESVLFGKDGLFVSLIDGQPWEADGKGEIAKLDLNGRIVNAAWATGLNAPKGMGLWNNKLYVADISDVVVINATTGKIESRIAVFGATGLNDITVDSKGLVYVSDSREGKVHKIRNGKADFFLDGMKGVNGLKAVGDDLFILKDNGMFRVIPDKKMAPVATMSMGGDGIEPVGNGDFIVSYWVGMIYYVTEKGTMEKLLDTRDQKKNTADIGYDAANKIVYVPTFFKKSVVAYQLK